jgi:hypothetical protein
VCPLDGFLFRDYWLLKLLSHRPIGFIGWPLSVRLICHLLCPKFSWEIPLIWGACSLRRADLKRRFALLREFVLRWVFLTSQSTSDENHVLRQMPLALWPDLRLQKMERGEFAKRTSSSGKRIKLTESQTQGYQRCILSFVNGALKASRRFMPPCFVIWRRVLRQQSFYRVERLRNQSNVYNTKIIN